MQTPSLLSAVSQAQTRFPCRLLSHLPSDLPPHTDSRGYCLLHSPLLLRPLPQAPLSCSAGLPPPLTWTCAGLIHAFLQTHPRPRPTHAHFLSLTCALPAGALLVCGPLQKACTLAHIHQWGMLRLCLSANIVVAQLKGCLRDNSPCLPPQAVFGEM